MCSSVYHALPTRSSDNNSSCNKLQPRKNKCKYIKYHDKNKIMQLFKAVRITVHGDNRVVTPAVAATSTTVAVAAFHQWRV